MSQILIVLFAALLVTLLIRLLHAAQAKKSREIADQSDPLPPLTDSEPQTPPFSLESGPAVMPATSSGAGAWQDEVKALRDAGQFREALALCNRQYPKMLAFRQTLITLRSQLKQAKETADASLEDIYRTALLADLARATRELSKTTDEIKLAMPALDDARRYWPAVGYEKLDLLTKTDRNLLERHWGAPQSHHHVSEWLNTAANVHETSEPLRD